MEILPPELLAQLSAMPEQAPEDFTCVICRNTASNRWRHSPKEYERPPICRGCEVSKGYSWNGGLRQRVAPSGGSFRDRRNALRIAALADEIDYECQRQTWSKTNAAA